MKQQLMKESTILCGLFLLYIVYKLIISLMYRLKKFLINACIKWPKYKTNSFCNRHSDLFHKDKQFEDFFKYKLRLTKSCFENFALLAQIESRRCFFSSTKPLKQRSTQMNFTAQILKWSNIITVKSV